MLSLIILISGADGTPVSDVSWYLHALTAGSAFSAFSNIKQVLDLIVKEIKKKFPKMHI